MYIYNKNKAELLETIKSHIAREMECTLKIEDALSQLENKNCENDNEIIENIILIEKLENLLFQKEERIAKREAMAYELQLRIRADETSDIDE